MSSLVRVRVRAGVRVRLRVRLRLRARVRVRVRVGVGVGVRVGVWVRVRVRIRVRVRVRVRARVRVRVRVRVKVTASTKAAEVDGIVCGGVEEGWLQDGCREDDLVEVGVVVGVDLLRQHEPPGAVGRSIGKGHLSLMLEGARTQHVAKMVALHDAHSTVVDPAVREADLDTWLGSGVGLGIGRGLGLR